jgi:hypothetical protein
MLNCWSRDKWVTSPWVGRSHTCNGVVEVDGFEGIAVYGGEISLLCLSAESCLAVFETRY